MFAISSIIKADFDYIDDLGRVSHGYREWGFNRHLTNILSVFVHTDTFLTDISPLTQILAAFILALSSIIILYIFLEEKNISLFNIISVLPLGLSPYFLECISYKFDSPYMALSILESVVPFL